MGSTPLEQSIIVIAMMAADDCTHMVSTLPMMRNTIVVRKLSLPKEEKNCNTGWLCAKSMSIPVCLSVPRARLNEMPKMKSPVFAFLRVYQQYCKYECRVYEIGDIECEAGTHNPCREGGLDIGAHDDRYGLCQGEQSGVDK